MKTNLMRAAAAAMIAALAAGAVLPGEAAAKPKGKPPISKYRPLVLKKGPALYCVVLQTGRQRKVRVLNSLKLTLSKHTRIFWRAKGTRGSASGVIVLNKALAYHQHVDRNAPSTVIGCQAWVVTPVWSKKRAGR